MVGANRSYGGDGGGGRCGDGATVRCGDDGGDAVTPEKVVT